MLLNFTTLATMSVARNTQPDVNIANLTFWYTENNVEEPTILAAVSAFEAAYPEINIEPVQIPYYDAVNCFLNRHQYGGLGDVHIFRAATDWLPALVAEDQLVPVSDLYTLAEWAQFLEPAQKIMSLPHLITEQEETWGVCDLLSPTAILVNRQLMQTAGIDISTLNSSTSWTWNEYWNILAQANRTAGVYATSLPGMIYGAEPFLYGHGGELFENGTVSEGTIALASPNSREGWDFVKNLTDSHYTHPYEDQGWGSLYPLFNSGQVAMSNQGPWDLKRLLLNSPEFNSDVSNAKPYANASNLDIIQLPHGENSDNTTRLFGKCYVMSTDVQVGEKTAAETFIRFITSENQMKEMAQELITIPTRPAILEDPTFQEYTLPGTEICPYTYIKPYFDAISRAFLPLKVRYWEDLDKKIAENFHSCLGENQSINRFIHDTVADWKAIISAHTTIDPPNITILSPVPGGIYEAHTLISVDINDTDTIMNATYRWDGGDISEIPVSHNISLPTYPGEHLLEIWAEDETEAIGYAVFLFTTNVTQADEPETTTDTTSSTSTTTSSDTSSSSTTSMDGSSEIDGYPIGILFTLGILWIGWVQKKIRAEKQ